MLNGIHTTGAGFLIVLCAVALLAGCGGSRTMDADRNPNEVITFSGTSYMNPGDWFDLIVDVRPSWIAGRAEFLPLQVAIRNKTNTRIEFTKESFTLVGANGAKIPLVTNFEFEREYRRMEMDRRAGEAFLEVLNGRFPTPPYQKRNLEFFPSRNSRIVPRDEQSIRNSEIVVGMIYFRLPGDDFIGEDGWCTLLFRPTDHETSFVLNLPVYKN